MIFRWYIIGCEHVERSSKVKWEFYLRHKKYGFLFALLIYLSVYKSVKIILKYSNKVHFLKLFNAPGVLAKLRSIKD